ncbi:unnamed protein product [Moneuplotes crassus]|uniref:PNPLA domain-containing protein n=1 Tax=Euplotes crassus TaxID=5936 RepID=A0AAD2CW13_EUPCR|nr:unnamed protein product [Moneuplotes crassus]
MSTNKSKAMIILLLLGLMLVGTTAAPCKALVLEAGGDKGAYQAGALKGLYEALGGKEIDYDVVSGVSVGAINAMGVSIFPSGEEKELTDWMIEFWEGMTRDKVFVNWPYSVAEGLFWHKGLFNNSVFIDYVKEVAPRKEIFKKVTLGATDLKTGKFVRFTEALGFEDLGYKGSRASSAIPGIFPAVDFMNMTLVDGGVENYLDVGGAIDRCKEIANKDEEITIDIIMCNGNTLEEVDTTDFNTIDVVMRYRAVKKYRDEMKWVNDALMNFPRVNFRYLVIPERPLSGSIFFTKKHTRNLINLGMEDAQKAVEKGPYSEFHQVKGIMQGVYA